ncbi:MAG: S41 family peptidase [Rhodospirillales bacterium]
MTEFGCNVAADRRSASSRQLSRHKPIRRGLLAFTAVVAFAAGLLPALSGCADETPSFQRIAEAVGIDPYRVSSDTNRELNRFNDSFALYASDPQNTRQLKQFRDAFKRIRTSYVEDVADSKLIDAALEGIKAQNAQPHSVKATELVEAALDAVTASLDPHSAYLNPDELRESELVTSGEFGGLGLQVTQEDGKLKVISPIEGTPADRAGLKPGDVISHLDGKPVEGMSLRNAVNAMRGKPGSTVKLTIQRDQAPPFDVAITRAVITIEPVRWRMESDIAYLRVVSFNERTAEAVEAALKDIRNRQGGDLRGIVLDLRNNPGGLLDQSLAVADDFIEDGVIVTIRGREHGSDRTFWASSGDLAREIPLVVLVNAGSASASEIVAAALQDHGRATVMGARTFGKGSVQTVMRLPIEGALKLTTALYYAPSGEAIQAQGVVPDIQLVGAPTGEEESHEADLPHALPPQSQNRHISRATVEVSKCPEIGDAKDRELGCALSFLRAGGSTDRFLAALAQKAKL